MKITYTSAGGAVALADPDADRHADAVELSISRGVQVADFTRANESLPLPRGNAICRVSFSVNALFETQAPGMQAALTEAAGMDASGELVFEFTGDAPAEVTIANAVLENISSRQMGATVIFNYQFLGSLPTP